MCVVVNPQKTGIGSVIAIFWTVNDSPGLQGLMEKLVFQVIVTLSLSSRDGLSQGNVPV